MKVIAKAPIDPNKDLYAHPLPEFVFISQILTWDLAVFSPSSFTR